MQLAPPRPQGPWTKAAFKVDILGLVFDERMVFMAASYVA